MAQHNETGKWGEGMAAAYLQEKGYIILEHDWRSGHRDIDLVARKDDLTVFVEVKTRADERLVEAVKAVDYQKRQNLRKAINSYVKMHEVDTDIRFDVIAVIGTPGSMPRIEHLEDVWIF